MTEKKPLLPVKPVGMEVVLFYPCPHCGRRVPLVAPLQASMAQCDSCSKQFPVVPADQRSIQFIKVMLDEGKAAINPDYI